jgi:hypothetical protein
MRSVFELKNIKALIINTRRRQDNNEDLSESDYNLLTEAILPYYFPYDNGWIIGAEVWNIDPSVKHCRADLVVLSIDDGAKRNYGDILPYVVYEGKKRNAYTWQNLLREQLFDECQGLVIDNDRIWAIGQIGLEICVFRFDLNNYKVPGRDFTFENFSPLNINNWSPAELDARHINHITLNYGNNLRITHVIRWELDNLAHQPEIHRMLEYIARNNV